MRSRHGLRPSGGFFAACRAGGKKSKKSLETSFPFPQARPPRHLLRENLIRDMILSCTAGIQARAPKKFTQRPAAAHAHHPHVPPCAVFRTEAAIPATGQYMTDQPNRPSRSRPPREGQERPRRPLRETVCEIDRDILRLLLRRANILARMRGGKARLDPTEEKTIREAWEAAVTRVSRDARLSGRFFSLMQDVEFLPKPAAPHDAETGDAPASAPRTAFNLAPPSRAVRLRMPGPLACRATRAWLMLAAATGQPLRLAHCLMNDPLVDCVKMLCQAGAALTREGDGVIARQTAPLAAPDKVIHVGDSAWNFFLLLGHYLGRPSRAKFTGATGLKLADLSSVRRFLPALGARLTPVIPRSEGLPARLECSGMLPDSIALPADVPAALAEGILLAAPGYAAPLTLDLTGHPARELVLARTFPLLRATGADMQAEGYSVRMQPSGLRLPAAPEIPMEPELAVFLLALPLVLGGEAQLDGIWPVWAKPATDMLQTCGLDIRLQSEKGGSVLARAQAPLKNFAPAAIPADFPAAWAPLPLALAACAALRGGESTLPPLPPQADPSEAEGFLHAVGLEQTEDGRLQKREDSGAGTVWNAPSPAWALALALAACASPHQKLGNPGIMTGLYPAFWSLYNALPEPALRRPEPPAEPLARRRVITGAIAVPPEIRDDDL